MNIRLATRVNGYYENVIKHFDRELFEALSPKIADLEIVEFTGSTKGDRVHLRFHKPFRAEWISKITEDGRNQEKAWFVDEGVQLPFGISYWKHRHIVEKIDDQTSLIVDDIYFKGKNWLHTLLMYPFLYFGFYPRKQVYRNYFNDSL